MIKLKAATPIRRAHRANCVYAPTSRVAGRDWT
jgi:hypothetical protein